MAEAEESDRVKFDTLMDLVAITDPRAADMVRRLVDSIEEAKWNEGFDAGFDGAARNEERNS